MAGNNFGTEREYTAPRPDLAQKSRDNPLGQTEIDRGFGMLMTNLDTLEKAIAALHERTTPVTQPQVPQGHALGRAADPSTPPRIAMQSPMGERIEGLSDRVNESVSRVEDLLRRLCL